MVEDEATVRPTDRLSEFAPDEQGLISAVAMAKYPELDSGSEAALRQSLEQCLQTLKINASHRRFEGFVGGVGGGGAARGGGKVLSFLPGKKRFGPGPGAVEENKEGKSEMPARNFK